MACKITEALQKEIDKNIGKSPKDAVEAMIQLGEHYRQISKHEQAVVEFKKAEKYVADNFADEDISKTEFEYRIDNGFLYGLEKDALYDALKQMIDKYSEIDFNIELKENVAYNIANNLIMLEKYAESHKYLKKSIDLLKKFPNTKDLDYNLRSIRIYDLSVEVAVYEKNPKESIRLLNVALDFDYKSQEPESYFSLLGYQRKHLPREERMKNSNQMLAMCNGSTKLKGKKLDAYYNLFEDYFFEKEFEKAEECLWRAWSEYKVSKPEKFDIIEKCFIFMYKRPQRLKDIETFETAKNFEEVVLIYNQMGTELHKIGTFEAAYDFWLEMKEAAEKITDFKYYTKDEYIKTALEFISLSFYEIAVCQKDFKLLLKYLKELYKKQVELDATDKILIPVQFHHARILALLDDKPYEKKKRGFKDVENKLFTDYQKYKYHCDYIKLIKNCGNDKDKAELPDLQIELEILKEKIKDGKKVPPPYLQILNTNENVQNLENVPESYEENENNGKKVPPSISEDEKINEKIFEDLEKKWKEKDEIEYFKNQLDEKNKVDVLHEVCSSEPDMKHLQFLFEKCGYDAIIDNADKKGFTALYYAVKNGHYDIVKYLIKNDANMNLSTNDKNSNNPPGGSTPLMEAVRQKNPQIIRLLIESNANPLMADSNGKTALKLLNGIIDNDNKDGRKSSKKKEVPIPESLLVELRETQKLLMETEQKFMDEDRENHGEQMENQPPQKSDNKRKRQQPARFTGDEAPKKTRKR